MEPKRSLWAVAYGFRIGGRSRSFIPMVPRLPVGAREITMLLPSAGSVAGKISMGIARCGETARSMNSTSPTLLSRLRQMIFTGLAYRSTQQHKTGEANGCRHGEMSGDRTRHPHRSRHRSQELRCHPGLFRSRLLPDLPERA